MGKLELGFNVVPVLLPLTPLNSDARLLAGKRASLVSRLRPVD